METKSTENCKDEEQKNHYYYSNSTSPGLLSSLEDEEIKRKICCHSLYGLLVQTHLDCLKVFSSITLINKLGFLNF